MDQLLVVVAADARSATGRLVAQGAWRHGHRVRMLSTLGDPTTVHEAVAGADAIVIVPRRGDVERHAHDAARTLVAAAGRCAPAAHLLLVSSFAVGHGPAHPFNRAAGLLPGMPAAEQALRASGLAATVVRSTWLTDDPPGAHALTLTQDPYADGMLSRADLAGTLVAAIEHPAARDTTFALFNEPGPAERHWERWFSALARDTAGTPA